LPDYSEGILADLNQPLSVENVQRLSELLPQDSEVLDHFALRPTAASLGLKDAIKECLGADPIESGYFTKYCYMAFITATQSIHLRELHCACQNVYVHLSKFPKKTF